MPQVLFMAPFYSLSVFSLTKTVSFPTSLLFTSMQVILKHSLSGHSTAIFFFPLTLHPYF